MTKPSIVTLCGVQRAPHAAAIAVVFLLAVVYSVFVVCCVTNFPKGDDFLAILPPAIAVAEKGVGAVTLNEVFAQHFSHRIAPVRILAMAQVLLCGHLNFSIFSWVGIACWCGAFALLASQQRLFESATALLCAALIWFQPEASSNVMAPMQAASNLPVILFAFGAFAARRATWRGSWALAWMMALLALATTGNGFVVLGILLLWDALTNNWRGAAIGMGISVAVAILYFSSFDNPDSQKYFSGFVDVIGNGLVMMGAIFKLGPLPLAVAMVGGAILSLVSIGVCLQAAHNKDFFTAAALMFVLGSAAMASFARAGWGNEYMLQSRYMVYPLIAASVCVGHMVGKMRMATLANAALLICAVFYAVCWWHYVPDVIGSRTAAKAEAMSWSMGHPSHRFSGDPASNLASVKQAVEQLHRAEKLGIFTPWETGLVPPSVEIRNSRLKVASRWDVASAGYLIDCPLPGLTDFDMVVVSLSHWKQVAFRPPTRFAIGRWLRGEPQRPGPLIFAAPDFEAPDRMAVVAQPIVRR